ncbi:hypothetical protein PTKIN_Ptkin16aG0014100 [Pterospermum kingtungense]
MEDKGKSIVLSNLNAMIGGDGPNSYAQNSVFQRGIIESAKVIINEEITMKLDIQKLSSAISDTFRIADLGCSCGPNTILAIQYITEAIESKFQSHGLTSPEFQVFFNDQVGNDFNSLFASLPVDRKYYAAGVPGSFHGRLFPKASLHFVYSSSALHWLSKVPAWNKGRIHYTGAPKEVFEAYSDQFAKQVNSFLNARVQELVPGGLIAFVLPSVPDVSSHPEAIGSDFEILGSCLVDMAKMGMVSEAKVDAFNIPFYSTCPKELRRIIEGNGCFSIERMEILNNLERRIVVRDPRQRMLFMRATVEMLIEKHFGTEIIDQLFEMYSKKLSESSLFLNPENYQQSLALFVLLKNKIQ